MGKPTRFNHAIIMMTVLTCFSAVVRGQGMRNPDWTDADIQNCLKNPPKTPQLQYVFDSNAKKVINAFFGSKGDCLYGNYCGKTCKGGKAIDDLDTCCMNFKNSKYTYDAYSNYVRCYGDVSISYQCACAGKLQPTMDKCNKSVKGCLVKISPASAKKQAFLDLMDSAVGGEDAGGMAYCYNGNAGGDGENPN